MSIRTLRFLALAAALAAPASAATTADVAAEAVSDAQFEASFAGYETLPPAPAAAPGEVDLDSFEPPVEPATKPLGSGVASFYGRRFHGRPTASGERFDMHAMTAAHRTLPFGSLVRVTNPANGRSVTVRINDRGPFHGGRVIDVSRAAADELGLVQRGHGTVELALLD